MLHTFVLRFGCNHSRALISTPSSGLEIIIRTPPNSFSKMSKTGKNVKNPLYIRYNLQIRYI